MITYSLMNGAVTVSIDADASEPHKRTPIVYTGEMVPYAQDILSIQYGAFGHLIGDATTPVDLDAAMQKPDMQAMTPVLVQGLDVEDYDPGIPEGAKS